MKEKRKTSANVIVFHATQQQKRCINEEKRAETELSTKPLSSSSTVHDASLMGRKNKGHQSIRTRDLSRWSFISLATHGMTWCWCMKQESIMGAGMFTLKPFAAWQDISGFIACFCSGGYLSGAVCICPWKYDSDHSFQLHKWNLIIQYKSTGEQPPSSSLSFFSTDKHEKLELCVY